MKIRTNLTIAFLMLVISAQAQVRNYSQKSSMPESSFVERYMDSLKNYKMRIDSFFVFGAPQADDLEYSKLFLPVTFYKNVAHDNFTLDKEPSMLDRTFMNIYLNRPDLISATETQLDKTGGTLEPTKVKINQAPELVDKVAPKPIEPQTEDINLIVKKPHFWNYSGNYDLQFMQNYFSSNWYKGGESNLSLRSSLTLNANYNNKQKVKWDNRLELKIGFQTSKQDTMHSIKVNDNLIRLTSTLGLQATKKWYYTIQLQAYTQFMRQWKSNSNVVTTDFLGPLNVNLSIGMDYNVDWLKHKLKGSIHLAPLSYNFKYVNRDELATRYGIEAGKRQLHDFGSQMTINLNWNLMNNLSWNTRLYGYTTYERTELEWENTFTLKVNKWISSKIFVYPRFDDGTSRDDHHGYWQFKEYASVGFSYSF